MNVTINQMTNDGTNTLTYDSNGNLTSDGVNSYTWDRANRMLTAPGSTSYKYDGDSNRIQQTVSSVVTDYLNDVQPELTKLLAQTTGANTEHFIHGVRGIHAQEDNLGHWEYMAQDGLGSVRSLIDDSALVIESRAFDEYGSLVSGSMAQSPIAYPQKTSSEPNLRGIADVVTVAHK